MRRLEKKKKSSFYNYGTQKTDLTKHGQWVGRVQSTATELPLFIILLKYYWIHIWELKLGFCQIVPVLNFSESSYPINNQRHGFLV